MRWRADIQRREAITVTVAALLGMPIGIAVLTRADDQVLTAIIGVTILVLTAWLWRGLQLPTGRTTELTAGFASGALAASVGTNGPPLVIAFQATGMPPEPFRATLQVCFFVEGAIALLLFWSQGLFVHDVGPIVLVGLPASACGALLGDRFAARVHQGPFRTAVLALLALSGVLALDHRGPRRLTVSRRPAPPGTSARGGSRSRTPRSTPPASRGLYARSRPWTGRAQTRSAR